MIRIKGDLWSYTTAFVVIPINLEGVCGRGLAKQMASKNPHIATSLRQRGKNGSLPEEFDMDGPLQTFQDSAEPGRRLVMFPVKNSWKDEASLEIIARSSQKLVRLLGMATLPDVCIMPMVGCGFGERRPEDVLPVIEPILAPMESRIFIIEPDDEVFQRYESSFKPGLRADRSAIEANIS